MSVIMPRMRHRLFRCPLATGQSILVQISSVTSLRAEFSTVARLADVAYLHAVSLTNFAL